MGSPLRPGRLIQLWPRKHKEEKKSHNTNAFLTALCGPTAGAAPGGAVWSGPSLFQTGGLHKG